jgi:hypothetical protein
MKLEQAQATELALIAANNSFEERHPTVSRPEWALRSITQSTRFTEHGTIEVSYKVECKVPLEPNQAWEKSSSGLRLIETDFASGKRSVVLTRDPGKFIELFRVVFHIANRNSEVILDVDFGTIDPRQIELWK